MDFCLRVWLLPAIVLRCLLVVKEDEGKGKHLTKRRGEPSMLQPVTILANPKSYAMHIGLNSKIRRLVTHFFIIYLLLCFYKI